MSLRKETPCDFGPCPYNAEYFLTCDYYCSEPEEEDYPDDCDYETGFDPYLGCFTDDC